MYVCVCTYIHIYVYIHTYIGMNKQRPECVNKIIPTTWAAVYFMAGPCNFFVTHGGHHVRLHIKSFCVLYRREATQGHASTTLAPAPRPCPARVFREAGQAAVWLIYLFICSPVQKQCAAIVKDN